MHTIPVKLVQIGTSTGFVVPASVARLLRFEPGTTVNALLAPGVRIQHKLIRSSRASVAMLVPVDVLTRLGWKKGDEVSIPFLEWETAERPAPRVALA